jgi:ORF6N domain
MQIAILQQKIHDIRECKVMLDFDLAELYDVNTKVLNQAVKRNVDRFPEDFMFRLTSAEWELLRPQILNLEPENGNWSQFVTSSKKHRGVSYLPYAFTEHGVTMLASVLRSPLAVQMNISIVRAFIALREMAMNYKELAEKIRDLETRYNKQFADIYEALKILLGEKGRQVDFEKREWIGFKTSKS